MAVILPTFPGPQSAEPYFRDAGGVQRGFANGEDMRMDRLGDRFGATFTLVPMRWNDFTLADRSHAARVWLARLIRGMSEGVIIPFPQPNFRPPGNPSTVAAAVKSGAAQVLMAQVGGAVRLLEGQMITHIRAATGLRYNYMVRADTDVGANGQAMLPIWPRVRGPMAPGDVLLIKDPTLAGLVQGDQQGWSLALSRLASISFRVEERA